MGVLRLWNGPDFGMKLVNVPFQGEGAAVVAPWVTV